MASIKVMGHCPPDTDSTCSPISYAWFLKTIKGMDVEAVIGGGLNKEAQFVLSHFGIETPHMIESVTEGDKLVIIDTNNPEELITGWEKAEIIEIVDHHKLYGLKTANIPTVTIKPYGCVATVLWEIMTEAHDKLPKEIAGLMAACIISDTLNLTSPTTTEKDKQALTHLVSVAGIDVQSFSQEMFAAKSNLDGLTDEQILLTDAKDFEFGGAIYKIGVLETTAPNQALAKKDSLVVAMNTLKQKENLAGMMFFVVDIIQSSAVLLTSSEEDLKLGEKAFSVTAENGVLTLPGIVSRKKQIVPAFEKIFNA
ncbi:manganese-dependent inorganic pyrophosphatase [Candidatus Woesebacteria bacterium]|nr:manganese-dependent inorganic pyrophosphatase [Candidatus Woesebacteria bacterium]